MEFKFLMAALMPVMSSSRYEASPKTCRLRWVKLNKTPVCFGTKGYQLGRFSHHRNIFLSSFMFVHRSGKGPCNKKDCSYWGCVLDANVIGVLLTDENNKILAPEAAQLTRVDGTILRDWVAKVVFLLQILLIFSSRCNR